MSNEGQGKTRYNVIYMSGVEGPSFYLNDTRIAGPKPWGGGSIIKEYKTVTADDLRYAVPELAADHRDAQQLREQLQQQRRDCEETTRMHLEFKQRELDKAEERVRVLEEAVMYLLYHPAGTRFNEFLALSSPVATEQGGATDAREEQA